MKESKLESDCVALAERRGVPSIKLNGQGDDGKPDRLFLFPHRAVFMEFKREGEQARELQDWWRRLIQALHLSYYLIDTQKDFELAFAQVMEKVRADAKRLT